MERGESWEQLVEWDLPHFKIIRVNPRGHSSWWILWRPKGVAAPSWRFQKLMASDRLEALQEALMILVERKCSVTVKEPKGRRWPEKKKAELTTEQKLKQVLSQNVISTEEV